MIVVDASALAKYVLREDNWELVADAMKARTVSLDHVVKEVANAIWRRAFVLRAEPAEVAARRYRILRKLVERGIVELEDELAYVDEAFSIALRTGLTVYDALYVAQAARRGAALLTSDEKQARVARELGLQVIYVP